MGDQKSYGHYDLDATGRNRIIKHTIAASMPVESTVEDIRRATNSSRRIITKHNEVSVEPLGGPESLRREMDVTSPNIQGPVVSSDVGRVAPKNDAAKATRAVPKRRIVR